MCRSYRISRDGFSLAELLIVIGTMGILLGLLLPGVQQTRATAARLSCLSNLKQIGLALHGYHDVHGRLPAPLPGAKLNDPSVLLNWMALILPQIEQEALWKASVAACQAEPRPWINPPHLGFATIIKLYVCRADSRLTNPLLDRDGITSAFTSYTGVAGSQGKPGVIVQPGIRLIHITDGMSNTIMVGERPPPA